MKVYVKNSASILFLQVNSPKEWGRFYSILFNNRSAADYEDFKNFDLAATQEMYPKVCAFIGLIDNWVFDKN